MVLLIIPIYCVLVCVMEHPQSKWSRYLLNETKQGDEFQDFTYYTLVAKESVTKVTLRLYIKMRTKLQCGCQVLKPSVLSWRAASFVLHYLVMQVRFLPWLLGNAAIAWQTWRNLHLRKTCNFWSLGTAEFLSTSLLHKCSDIPILPKSAFRIWILIWIQITQFHIHIKRSE